MRADTSNTEHDFKAQLDRAVTHRVLCARFEWYGPATADDAGQCPLLGANLFLWERIFEKMEETFRFGDPLHPNSDRLNHVLIYLFDGRDGSPKFHGYLWKPSMGRDLQPLEYSDTKTSNPYQPYVEEALWAQSGAAKVSTVVKQAMKRVRKEKAVGLPDYLPMEAHEVFLRDTLMRLRHTDPLIHFNASNSADLPHVDRGAMVEHLGIYDRNPTWDN